MRNSGGLLPWGLFVFVLLGCYVVTRVCMYEEWYAWYAWYALVIWVCKAGGREIRENQLKVGFGMHWYAEFKGGGGAAPVGPLCISTLRLLRRNSSMHVRVVVCLVCVVSIGHLGMR